MKHTDLFKYNAHIYSCECFVVVTNSDISEGRGHRIELGVFAQAVDAAEAAEGKGVMGTPASIETHLYDIVVPLNSRHEEEWLEAEVLGNKNIPFIMQSIGPCKLREVALAKLTQYERELLGLE